MGTNKGVIAVDLDGVLASSRHEPGAVGDPVHAMCDRVLTWLGEGRMVVIFTARDESQHEAIAVWAEKQFGERLMVTNVKSRYFTEIWDDCAVRVERDTGRQIRDWVAR